MNNKKLFFSLFLLIISLTLITNAYAQTVVIDSPIDNQRFSSGSFLTTYTVSDNNENITNLTLYAISGATETLLSSVENGTASQNLTWNMTIDFSGNLTNANDYQLTVRAYSEVTGANLFTDDFNVTGVDIDTVSPTVSFTLDKGFTRRSDPVGLAVDCTGSSDATTGIANYTITVTKPFEPQVNVTETNTNGKRSFTTTDIDSIGEYNAWCEVSDNTGNVGSIASQTFQVLSSSDGETVIATQIVKQQGQANVTLIVSVVLLILFAVGILTALLIFKGTKNKRK